MSAKMPRTVVGLQDSVDKEELRPDEMQVARLPGVQCCCETLPLAG